FQDFNEAQKVAAQTEAVLKSTGGAANVTSDEVSGLAGELSKLVGVDDEAIQAGENLLLTFTNIRNEAGAGNDIFNQATGIMLDLSTAKGTDVRSAALQLGKALNDPIKGVGALSRAGVQLTDQQKEQIAVFIESGDVLSAQKVILTELTNQVGGSAEAQATAADHLSVAWGNFKEAIGGVISLAITPLAKALTFVLTLIVDAPGPVKALAGVLLGTLVVALIATSKWFGTLTTSIKNAIVWMNVHLVQAVKNAAIALGTRLIPSLAGAAAAAVGFGAGLVALAVAAEAVYLAKIIDDIGKFNDQAEDAEARARALEFLLLTSSQTVEGYAEAWERLNDGLSDEDQAKTLAATFAHLDLQVQNGRLSLDEARSALVAMGLSAGEVDRRMKVLAETAAKSADEVEKSGKKYVQFAGLTREAFKEWAASLGESVKDAITSLGGFDKKWDFTAKSLRRIVAQMARHAQEIGRAFRLLNETAIPDQFRKWLLEQGPDAVRAFTLSNEVGKRAIIDSWRIVDRQANQSARTFRGLDRTAAELANHQRGAFARGVGAGERALRKAAEAAQDYRRQLEQLNGVEVSVNVRGGGRGGGGGSATDDQSGGGSVRPFQHGGIVRRPVVGLVGESGPEAVVPLHEWEHRRSERGPTTLRIVNWREGIARLADEGDWDDRSRA
ncbi:MAG: hypothetical protein ACRDHK_03580, partial [Actinomycetota bacterium]